MARDIEKIQFDGYSNKASVTEQDRSLTLQKLNDSLLNYLKYIKTQGGIEYVNKIYEQHKLEQQEAQKKALDAIKSALPPGWLMNTDSIGKPYYTNTETGVVQWTMPTQQEAEAAAAQKKQEEAQKKQQEAALKLQQEKEAAQKKLEEAALKLQQEAALKAQQEKDAAAAQKKQQEEALKHLQQQQELQKQLLQKQQALKAAAPHGKTVIDDDTKYNDAILKIIGLCMLKANTYLVSCSFNKSKFELAVQYYDPSAAFGSDGKNELRINGQDKVEQLFSIFNYEPLPIKSQSKEQSEFKLSSFFINVHSKINKIHENVGFYTTTNKTTINEISNYIQGDPKTQTTIYARYLHDKGLFLKYLSQNSDNIDALNDSSAVATWIANYMWDGYTQQEREKFGVKKTIKQGGFWVFGGTVVETYEQNPQWVRDVVDYYQYLAPVFKCVFDAQVIEPPAPAPGAKPVASPQPQMAAAAPPQPQHQTAVQMQIAKLEEEILEFQAKLFEEDQSVKSIIANEGKKKAATNPTVKQKITIIKQYRTAIGQKNELIAKLKVQDEAAGKVASALATAASTAALKPVVAPAQPTAAQTAAPKPPIAPTSATLPSVAPIAQGSVIDGNLINDKSTMCYLDAAMQMLLAIPEIPQFFATNAFDQINGLKIIDESQRQLRGCTYGVKPVMTPEQKQEKENMISNAKKNIKLFKLIFENIRNNNSINQRTSIVSLKFTANSKDYSVYRTLVQDKGESFLKSGNYVQADPNEFMTSVFFNNFDCFDIPSIIGQDGVGIMDTLTITCSGGSIINDPKNRRYNSVLPLQLDSTKGRTSIQRLIDKYIAVEPMNEVVSRCGSVDEDSSDATLTQLKNAVTTVERSKPTPVPNDKNTFPPKDIVDKSKEYETASMQLLIDPTTKNPVKTQIAVDLQKLPSNGSFNWANYYFLKINAETDLLSYKLTRGYTGIQTSQQRTLIPQKHVIFHTERKAATEDDQFARNTTPVDITKEVQINGSLYRIKGCIFHSGSGQSGHYVYGAYDEQGNPQYVINDIQTAGHPCNFDEVFRQQKGWLSTTYLYTRV